MLVHSHRDLVVRCLLAAAPVGAAVIVVVQASDRPVAMLVAFPLIALGGFIVSPSLAAVPGEVLSEVLLSAGGHRGEVPAPLGDVDLMMLDGC